MYSESESSETRIAGAEGLDVFLSSTTAETNIDKKLSSKNFDGTSFKLIMVDSILQLVVLDTFS